MIGFMTVVRNRTVVREQDRGEEQDRGHLTVFGKVLEAVYTCTKKVARVNLIWKRHTQILIHSISIVPLLCDKKFVL